jgi:antitoxin (DNA-binding transcriptional repressor) of toxin-antitoxin stability system
MIINISETKAHVSKLVNLVYQGQEVIISNNNLPMVELVIHKPEKPHSLVLRIF